MKTLQTSFFWSNNLFKLIETFPVFINPFKKLCITFVSLKTIASLGRIKLIICSYIQYDESNETLPLNHKPKIKIIDPKDRIYRELLGLN